MVKVFEEEKGFSFHQIPVENSTCQNCNSYFSIQGESIRGTQDNPKRKAMRYPCCPLNSFQELARRIAIVDIILAFLVAAEGLVFTALPNTYISVYNVYNIKGEIITQDFPHQSWIFVSAVIFFMFLLILEGWLFEILFKGATDMDRKKLNQWLNVRFIFLTFNVVLSLYRIVDAQFCLYDLIYVPVMMYRILEIIVIKGLTTEILDFPIQLTV